MQASAVPLVQLKGLPEGSDAACRRDELNAAIEEALDELFAA